MVEETCAENPRCAALTLTGACCPATDANGDEKWLDCCEFVPDECGVEGTCEPYSSEQFLLDMAAAESGVLLPSNLWALAFSGLSLLLGVSFL